MFPRGITYIQGLVAVTYAHALSPLECTTVQPTTMQWIMLQGNYMQSIEFISLYCRSCWMLIRPIFLSYFSLTDDWCVTRTNEKKKQWLLYAMVWVYLLHLWSIYYCCLTVAEHFILEKWNFMTPVADRWWNDIEEDSNRLLYILEKVLRGGSLMTYLSSCIAYWPTK